MVSPSYETSRGVDPAPVCGATLQQLGLRDDVVVVARKNRAAALYSSLVEQQSDHFSPQPLPLFMQGCLVSAMSWTSALSKQTSSSTHADYLPCAGFSSVRHSIIAVAAAETTPFVIDRMSAAQNIKIDAYATGLGNAMRKILHQQSNVLVSRIVLPDRFSSIAQIDSAL